MIRPPVANRARKLNAIEFAAGPSRQPRERDDGRRRKAAFLARNRKFESISLQR
jgi:hypothetical protein